MKDWIVPVVLTFQELMIIMKNWLFRSYRIGGSVKAAGIKPRNRSVL